ncbi:root hair specific 2 [Actinidia rufa]|uniref:Root hair specific 2 n=1 Tax=Actinidia rufa TaxID=165716 RepID=A0A7J0EPJ1_9ERIC|nr:root hair specific 2 [Actinidia rufa]
MVPTWPAKTWVTAPSEYWQTAVKMAGPARNHSFFDSTKNSPKKSLGLWIGLMSSSSATNEIDLRK